MHSVWSSSILLVRVWCFRVVLSSSRRGLVVRKYLGALSLESFRCPEVGAGFSLRCDLCRRSCCWSLVGSWVSGCSFGLFRCEVFGVQRSVWEILIWPLDTWDVILNYMYVYISIGKPTIPIGHGLDMGTLCSSHHYIYQVNVRVIFKSDLN